MKDFIVEIIFSLLLSGFFTFIVDDGDKKWYKSLFIFIILGCIFSAVLCGISWLIDEIWKSYTDLGSSSNLLVVIFFGILMFFTGLLELRGVKWLKGIFGLEDNSDFSKPEKLGAMCKCVFGIIIMVVGIEGIV